MLQARGISRLLWKSLEDPVPSSSWLKAPLDPLWKPGYRGRERGWRGVLGVPAGPCPFPGLLGQHSLRGLILLQGRPEVVSVCAPHSRKESEGSTGHGRCREHPCLGQRPPSHPQGCRVHTEAGHVFLSPSHRHHTWHRCCPRGFSVERSCERSHVLSTDPFSAEAGHSSSVGHDSRA